LKKLTYAESGVDIEKEEKAINAFLSNIKSKRKGIGKPLGGHYAGMIDFGEYALVLCTDGVGSKIEIAIQFNKMDTIGIDCIAMNVNDAICVGAEPLAFVDYLAIEDPKPAITGEIAKGLEKGASQSNISIIGGETASLPDIINGFDLAGTCLAYVKKNNIVTGKKIKPGDKIIGLSSSGLHSNGYSLVRRVIQNANLLYSDSFPKDIYPNKKIGQILLTPTRIYVKEILELLNVIKPHGLAHITGGGLRNLKRLNNNVKFIINNPIKPHPIFEYIQNNSNIDNKEMYQTFNMGMGFSVITPEEKTIESIKILKKFSESEVKIVGEVKKGTGVELTKFGLRY
jgi:phosphoribosylformylglycinamidine cyclo-ligase